MKKSHPTPARELRPGMEIELQHKECFVVTVKRNVGNMMVVQFYTEDDKPPEGYQMTVPPDTLVNILY